MNMNDVLYEYPPDDDGLPRDESIDWYEEYNSPCGFCGEVGHDESHCPKPEGGLASSGNDPSEGNLTKRAADVKPGPAEEAELYREQLAAAYEEILRKASRR